MSDLTRSILSVDEALDLVLAAFTRLPAETIDIADGLGRVLAQDVRADIDLPPFANSSMDGYAVRADDIVGATQAVPVSLKVVVDIPAGTMPHIAIEAGQAARIMTGAPMPVGADAVVPVEQTDDRPPGLHSEDRLAAPPPAQIGIYQPSAAGDYVRPVGEDIQAGQVILREGRVLRAADLGVLAGLGMPHVQVIRRPKVAILSTGDELLTADAPLTPGKIRDTNGYTIPALVQQLGAQVIRLGIARDTVEDVRAHLQQAVDSGADLILSSAGVSVGVFDVVKSVIESLGAIGFWRVNMRPGKPLAFGNISGVPFLGLPGNPVSAMVSFDVFARPAILKLAGRSLQMATIEAELAEPLHSDGRRSYIRVTLERIEGRLVAHSTGNQSSGVLTSLVSADGLLIIPDGMTEVPAGTRLPVRVFTENL
ncbi:MAG: gephyrin-like molybdotransferase Glp [Chloroflexota bacterium]